MRLSKRELKKLRDNLPVGSYEEIAEKTSLTPATVRAILFYPDRYKEDVIVAAIEIIENKKQAINNIKQIIKNI